VWHHGLNKEGTEEEDCAGCEKEGKQEVMKVMRTFPMYASGNCDFVTKRTKLDEDDQVVMFDVRAEALPVGNLCLHSNTVKMIVAKLKWQLMTPEVEAELTELRTEVAQAREQLAAVRGLITDLSLETTS
jgi:hypothetical protein